RFNKQVNFTVDKDTQHFRTQGQEDSLEVDYELSFGGIPLPGKPGTFLRENFHGCLENLYYNGVNIIDMAKRRKPQIYTVVRCLALLLLVYCQRVRKRNIATDFTHIQIISVVIPTCKHI
ncbi:contactin-associated protein-like 5, partial [Tachysurus ichikawai]